MIDIYYNYQFLLKLKLSHLELFEQTHYIVWYIILIILIYFEKSL